MSGDARILVASGAISDGELVARLLADEFSQVAVSNDSERAVADFEAQRPEVLVLAFNSLQKAESYYLGLYRLSSRVHDWPHRAVILCGKDDLRAVYELCRRDYFDDYVLFWPVGNDVTRLLLTTHHAVRRVRAGAPTLPEASIAQQARQLAQLKSILTNELAQGDERMAQANRTLTEAGQRVRAAMAGLGDRLVQGRAVDVRDPAGLRQALEQFNRDEIGPPLASASAATGELSKWLHDLPAELVPRLESARALGATERPLQPMLLVVDDDEFQHGLLRRLLKGVEVELQFANCAAEALAGLHRRKPALILMDINLPDMRGVDLTRKIKSTASLAGIPVVMITGDTTKQAVLESLQAGAADFLGKPFDRDALLGKLKRYIAHGQSPTTATAPAGNPPEASPSLPDRSE